ncbi:uncharacterized protein TNCV_1429111 [Trichonephila clavipes]|nr:uncharacterized protein TNCV_1429111 [Trichonephila clavipes]
MLWKLCVSDCIRWSRDIYIQHLTGTQQYSTDAAGHPNPPGTQECASGSDEQSSTQVSVSTQQPTTNTPASNNCVALLSDNPAPSTSFATQLQNYYGIAIRSNVGCLEKMQSAVIAAFFHCCSSNQNPMHGQCPTGKDSWCKYKQALRDGKVYVDKTAGLSNYVIKVIKPTYLALCDKELLKKMPPWQDSK